MSKLRNGVLVTIPPFLIRRLKSHFVTLPCGVDVILGLNGFIWVMKSVKENEDEGGEQGLEGEGVYRNYNDVSDDLYPGTRECSQTLLQRKLIIAHESLLHVWLISFVCLLRILCQSPIIY